MKFKVDENLPVEIADTLNEAGYAAVTIVAQRLRGAKDPALVDICAREE